PGEYSRHTVLCQYVEYTLCDDIVVNDQHHFVCPRCRKPATGDLHTDVYRGESIRKTDGVLEGVNQAAVAHPVDGQMESALRCRPVDGSERPERWGSCGVQRRPESTEYSGQCYIQGVRVNRQVVAQV